jgi:hypothetical protein
MFIRLSNRTQIAVLKYYIYTIKKFGVPKAIRADKGVETVLLAATQFAFRKAVKPYIQLEKTFAYGTSTKNQRIERWWRTLVDQQTDQWIAYFDELRGLGLFESTKFDRIALQYLYMDTLRDHIGAFVRMYNTYLIRRQVLREWYLPLGKPNILYNYLDEGIRNYATPPDPTLLAEIESQLSWFDDTAYLSPATRALCDDIVLQSYIEYDPTTILPGVDQPHTLMYKELRNRLYRWERSTGGIVEELQPPRGAVSTIEAMVQQLQNKGIDLANYEGGDTLQGEVEMDISEEGSSVGDSDSEYGSDGDFFDVELDL